MIKRILENSIRKKLGKKKIVVLHGPRQVGKTMLTKQLVQIINHKTIWLDAEEPDVRDLLTNVTSTQLKSIVGKHQLVVIDEAQKVEDIGQTLKIFADHLPDIQVIATGSSSFELANKLNEPLTGRKFEFFLYPISFGEMVLNNSLLEEKRLLEHRMLYGYYPELVCSPGEEIELLKQLTSSYLYKDILKLEGINKPQLLEKILQALSLQLGNEVSYNELAQLTGADNQTIEKYIDILEKTFVIFRLPSLSRNVRNEIKKGKKIYFYDNGIRNAIIKNFNLLNLRQDTGALWENFLVSERKKYNEYYNNWVNSFFWRTHTQQEIDYIEEKEGKLFGFEFKWNPNKKYHFPKTFTEAYPNSEVKIISVNNYTEFLLP